MYDNQNAKNCFEILYACCLYVFWSYIHSVFLDKLKTLDFIGNYFWKMKSRTFGVKIEKVSRIRDSHFVVFNFTTFGVFRLRFTSKRNIPAAFEQCRFLAKKAKYHVTKTPFFEKISRRIFLKFWWQTSNWCWGRYGSFAAISAAVFELSRKSGRGRYSSPPPPAGRFLSEGL